MIFDASLRLFDAMRREPEERRASAWIKPSSRLYTTQLVFLIVCLILFDLGNSAKAFHAFHRR